MKRHWPLLGLLLLLVVVGFYFVKAGTKIIKAPALLKDIVSGEGLRLKDIHYAQDNPDDRVKWVLDAKEVSFSSDRETIRFKAFTLRVEPEDRSGFQLKGDRGKYTKNNGKIELWGNLDGSSEDGYRIQTEYAMINEKKALLHSDRAVKISGPYFQVNGKGLKADLNGKRFEVLSAVTTVIKEDEIDL
ncbi:MAG: LPS export ABC transporter periplasmic protein LptC [Deltaproteobacteria bacterium]